MAKKKAAPKAADAATADEGKIPAKLTVKGGGKAPSTPDEHVVHAAKVIALASGEGFVRKGQISLFLTTIVKVADSAATAQNMIADAYDAGLLNAYVAPKKKAA
jgi:hypothetical protein